MAFVALNSTTTHRILDVINNMGNKERTEIQKKYGESVSTTYLTSDKEFVATVERALWGEYAHLRESMPEDWMTKLNTVRIVLTTSDTVVSVSTPLNVFYAPPKTDQYNCRVTMADSEFVPNPGLAAALDAKRAEHQEVDSRYNELRKSVKALLDQYNSLGALLKDHPEVMAIVPDDIKERHERKVVRKASSEAKPVMEAMGLEFDAGLLMSTFVAHKILVGQK